MRRRTIDGWLIGAVLGHLLITFVHGAAHSGAHVGLGPVAGAFVLLVIELAPLVGLALALAGKPSGGWIVAASMAASLVFGLVNHFVIISADHVSQVAAEWRSLFGVSAALLVISEAFGVVAGLRNVRLRATSTAALRRDKSALAP